MRASLEGKRILIIEDEFFIAKEIKRALEKAGAVIAGPVGDFSLGLEAAERGHLDAAILDVNLDGAMSFPIAERLRALGVPHLFLTGYDGWAFPDDFRATPHVVKPFSHEQLVAAVAKLCSLSAAR